MCKLAILLRLENEEVADSQRVIENPEWANVAIRKSQPERHTAPLPAAGPECLTDCVERIVIKKRRMVARFVVKKYSY
jgi:hypothetical protein